jgi:LysR substrate binding domain-containing protein
VVRTLTALAVTMAAMASQSANPSDWPSTTRPVSAANTGLTLMKTPKNLAGTRRSACRSATIGTRDIDDWLAIIAAGGGIGITPEGTTAQYRRDGVVFRPLQDAPPIAVRMIWRRHDPHPSIHAAVAMLTELYRRPS